MKSTINFFRSIRKQLLSEGKRGNYVKHTSGETPIKGLSRYLTVFQGLWVGFSFQSFVLHISLQHN